MSKTLGDINICKNFLDRAPIVEEITPTINKLDYEIKRLLHSKLISRLNRQPTK